MQSDRIQKFIEQLNLKKSIPVTTEKLNFINNLLLNIYIRNIFEYKSDDMTVFEIILFKYLTENRDFDMLNMLTEYNKKFYLKKLITFKAFKLINENNIQNNIKIAYYTFIFMYTDDIEKIEKNDILTYRINGDTILIYFINKYINNDIKDIDDFLDFYYWDKDLAIKLINYECKN